MRIRNATIYAKSSDFRLGTFVRVNAILTAIFAAGVSRIWKNGDAVANGPTWDNCDGRADGSDKRQSSFDVWSDRRGSEKSFGASVFGAGSRALNNGQFGSTANAVVTIGGLGRSFANDGENEGLA